MAEETLKERFQRLDSSRSAKLNRARECAKLTIPSLMPPDGWDESLPLDLPLSSMGTRGVTSLCSRMLYAIIPLNDVPFFDLALKSGVDINQPEVQNKLTQTTKQIYNKLKMTNLREVAYGALLSLSVVGDILLVIDDDLNLRTIRLDQYVVRRNVQGKLLEIIYVEYEQKPDDLDTYEEYYIQFLKGDDTWTCRRENCEGEPSQLAQSVYKICPAIPLRWSSIPGENYGRSIVEDLSGDLASLEGFTKAQLDGLAAASMFWPTIKPGGVTQEEAVLGKPVGEWLVADPNELATYSPGTSMNPQVQSAGLAVDKMRQEIGQSFLVTSASIPTGDRVTATAVRAVGSELENVLGGAFSSITSQLIEPVIMRAIEVMVSSGDLDKTLEEQFFNKDGLLSVDVLTGLQALNKDAQLNKYLQLGEIVRSLPPEAQARFKWSQYLGFVVDSFGLDLEKVIISEQEFQAMQQAAKQQELQRQIAAQMGGAAAGAMGNALSGMAAQDVAKNDGQGVVDVMQNMMPGMNALQQQ